MSLNKNIQFSTLILKILSSSYRVKENLFTATCLEHLLPTTSLTLKNKLSCQFMYEVSGESGRTRHNYQSLGGGGEARVTVFLNN